MKVQNILKTLASQFLAIPFQDGLELPNWPSWLVTIKHLSHTLIAFNSAVNFLIYAIL